MRKLFIDHIKRPLLARGKVERSLTGLITCMLILLVMASGHDSQLGDPTLLAKMDNCVRKESATMFGFRN